MEIKTPKAEEKEEKGKQDPRTREKNEGEFKNLSAAAAASTPFRRVFFLFFLSTCQQNKVK